MLCEVMAQLGNLFERLSLLIFPPNLKIGRFLDKEAWGTVQEGQLDGKAVAVKKILSWPSLLSSAP